ncbi:EF-hand domain and EF-hand domain pair-containing protein [Strongyloides ratti]|uniref:EF-hand domain and EF-hand domain pair-containing protein n=1 Tax=Strongyloides ratti TaxID=34506 RepID=A0A090L3W3_STRRB|nr:EF-hand domain and EF-hand domain pair-containing protein [Strongyloides ratti]CEF64412.1 EF-hand domain and EF-hand domain pair-containing protein [Strongyloides ratti]
MSVSTLINLFYLLLLFGTSNLTANTINHHNAPRTLAKRSQTYQSAVYIPDSMLIRDIENQPEIPKYTIPKIPSGFITIPAKFSPLNRQIINERDEKDPEIPRHPATRMGFNNIPPEIPYPKQQSQQFPFSGIQQNLQWNRFPDYSMSPFFNYLQKMQQNPSLNMFSTFPTDYHFPQTNTFQENPKNFHIAYPDIKTTNTKTQYVETYNDQTSSNFNAHNSGAPIKTPSFTPSLQSLTSTTNIQPKKEYSFYENTIQGIKNIPTSEVIGKDIITKNINHKESNNFHTSSLKKIPSTHAFDKTIDINLDGVLDFNEVEYAAFVHHGLSGSVVQDIFNSVDGDKNSVLDWKEFSEMKPLIIEKALNAAQRYLLNVDTDKNGKLSLSEAKKYVLKEYGIGYRDVERIWLLVVSNKNIELDVNEFAIFRRRLRGMSIRLARQIMKFYDGNNDYSMNVFETRKVAYEQEGINDEEVEVMIASCDDDRNGELNPAEFADFLRLVRAKSIDTSKRAMKVLDFDNSNTISLEEAKKIAFDHYGYDEWQLAPIFGQADENEDNQLDEIEFAGFRSVIRNKSIKTANLIIRQWDKNLNGMIDLEEAEDKTRNEDDLDEKDCYSLFVVADQNKDQLLDKVEFADFLRMVRSSSIKIISENMGKFDKNGDDKVTVDEISTIVHAKYGFSFKDIKKIFDRVDCDFNEELSPGEIVDFRHQTRLLAEERGIKPTEFIKIPQNKTMKLSSSSKKSDDSTKSIINNSETNIPTPNPIPLEKLEENMDLVDEVTTETTETTIKKNKKRRRRIKTTTSTTTKAPEYEYVSSEEVNE